VNRHPHTPLLLLVCFMAATAMADVAAERHGGEDSTKNVTVDSRAAKAPALRNEAVRTPGEPQEFERLTPHVQATRAGRLLSLDYQLLDASGKNRVDELIQQRQRNTPPRFTVWQDEREIGSGTFEYG